MHLSCSESPLQHDIHMLLKRRVVCQCSKCNGLHYGLTCMPPLAAMQTIQKELCRHN